VSFLDVGQADSILIQSDGETMLVDAGNRADGEPILSYLAEQGITTLNYAVASHPHEDHIGGYASILTGIPVEHYWMTDIGTTSNIYEKVLDLLDQENIDTQFPQAGDTITLGECTVSVLGPVRQYDDLNSNSLILKVTCGDVSFLLTGDQEVTAEEDLLASGADLSATVLKFGHHGSSTATSQAFYDAVSPSLGIISCGAGNDYGHPHQEILDLIQREGLTTYRTDVSGTIVVTTDGETWSVTTAPSVNSDGTTVEESSTTSVTTTGSSDGTAQSYIGNKNSKVVHSDSCSSLPAESNRVYFTSLDDARAEGYTACSRCNPQ
jgi:competence protein ComEC